MSGGFGAERRLAPRVAPSRVECRLDLRSRVRLLDISVGGALLGADVALPVGATARLHSGLGPGAFAADVQVRRRVAVPAAAPLNGLGAVFVTMDDRSRNSLVAFLRKASQ
ncbi:MAG: PilZ domain-containing protein [Acidobacteriota bacterium]